MWYVQGLLTKIVLVSTGFSFDDTIARNFPRQIWLYSVEGSCVRCSLFTVLSLHAMYMLKPICEMDNLPTVCVKFV